MENKKSLFVLLACALFASVLAAETLPPATEVPPPTTPAGTTTTPATPSSSTTAPSSTTVPPPPTTSTSAPTTTPTPAPTTPAPAPTTPAPTPSPFPDSLQKGNWTVSGDNVTCILAAMSVSAKIKYPVQGANTTLEKAVFVPSLAKAEGSCDPTSQWIKLTWGNNSMQVDFKKNDTAKMYFISQITYSLFADSAVFKNISTDLANKQYNFMRVKQDYMVNLNQSFHCTREQNLTLTNDGSKINAELFLSSVQLQAFHIENTAVFSAPQYCELDTPDIVPIAVGCALAALVIVVLVAYLVGRRRSQARGYLSM
ncbi:lysosome-associated membrane glycoprotein 1-like [Thrips palmi]|uniref:Lysosome-associated membrane glycoprotein 5 n=1 Tax=Thrips palmi TaxID=161013 RepID=A0A6P9A407_THRPL|nr:lysosome-associated membrane glycoprotein 1-like [Thrips palmi]